MDIFSQSEKLKQSLTPFIKKIISENTKECFRTYKARIVYPPNSENAPKNKCVVQIIGQAGLGNPTHLSVLYSTFCSDVKIGDMVWVATLYGSWKNAIAWQKIDFKTELVGENEQPEIDTSEFLRLSQIGKHLEIGSDSKLNVITTDVAESGNNTPITSSAVNTIVGNIDILLGII